MSAKKVYLDTNLLVYLFSEDMQHHQVIRESLTIVNPFKQNVNETTNAQYEVPGSCE